MPAIKGDFGMALEGTFHKAALTPRFLRRHGAAIASMPPHHAVRETRGKILGLVLALGLASGAAQAATLFEIPINGGIARLQLDGNCQETVCATLSWSETGGHPSAAAGPSAAPAAPAAPAPAPPAAVARLAPKEPAPSAANGLAPGPAGEWLVEDGDARIRITECGKNLCGFIAAAKNAGDTDRKNPNPALRSRPIIGLPVLLDMKPVRKRWEGKIYNAKNGQTYDANISLIDSQMLRVEGCVFSGLICGGQNWTRVN